MNMKMIARFTIWTVMLYLAGAFISAEWNSANWFPLLRIIIGFMWMAVPLSILASEGSEQ